MEDRRAVLLTMLTGFAERGERIPTMSDIGAKLGLPNREVRRQVDALVERGAFSVERRGKGGGYCIRIVLPGGMATSRWSPMYERADAPVSASARVFWLIMEAARDGKPAPSNHDIGVELGINRALVQSAIFNLTRAGRIKVFRTGTSVDGKRQFEVDGCRTAWAERSPLVLPARKPRSSPATIGGGDPPRPEQPIVARRLPRCPYDELPAGHHLCRHGWNGLTTAAQRRMIAAGSGQFSPRAAA